MRSLTPKQECFCQVYIETGNASEAYRRAYDAERMKSATINRNACALLKNNKIATRVAVLQSEHRKRHDISIDSLTSEYEDARQLAMDTSQPAAANGAITGKARLHGLDVNGHKHAGRNDGAIEASDTSSDLERARRMALLLGDVVGGADA